MSGHDIITIGASSGGVEALMALTRDLPEDLPAAVFIVLHLSPDSTSMLPHILGRRCPLPVAAATDGEPIRPGRVYVAVPDRHLIVDPGVVRVVRGPRENRHRPAVDVLFRSAARAYGPRVVGVVLTGALDDGSAGLLAIKRQGGLAIVQDPDEALIPSMPVNALRHAPVDHTLRLAAIPAKLAALAGEPPAEKGAPPVPREIEYEVGMARQDPVALRVLAPPNGALSSFTCPECHGPIWEIQDNSLLRFRCRTGHAYTADSFLEEQSEALEAALWMAVNTLEESAQMSARLATEAGGRGHHLVQDRFTDKARTARERAAIIRQVIHNGEVEGATRSSEAVAEERPDRLEDATPA